MIRIRNQTLNILPKITPISTRPFLQSKILINYRFNSYAHLKETKLTNEEITKISDINRNFLLAKGEQNYNGFILPALLPIDDDSILAKIFDFSSDYTELKGKPYSYQTIEWRGNATIKQFVYDLLFLNKYFKSDERKDYIFEKIYNEKNLIELSKQYELWKILKPNQKGLRDDDPLHSAVFKAYIGGMHLQYGERDDLFQDWLERFFEPMVEKYNQQWDEEGLIEKRTYIMHDEALTRKIFAKWRKKVTEVNGKERLSTVTKCHLKFQTREFYKENRKYKVSEVIINRRVLGEGKPSTKIGEAERFAGYDAIKFNKYLVLEFMKEMMEKQRNEPQMKILSPLYGNEKIMNNQGFGYKLFEYSSIDLLREKPKNVWDTVNLEKKEYKEQIDQDEQLDEQFDEDDE
ncbi:hypothetical protein BN7_1231 [Wickerhamomyces ciferrii]|uniref:RNase III domain-containing protein n=1 Tax=Wickerhamomyces ciferrii (strain ATCC 14091 / BCRC 22168 / CBS 111 / JCM 3599 / NBRC 0793 / NRRL Y-1031 F-60-10) TaxID=1206466 RepID=K0K9T5_WICCF|nr:uncharacterized protein BN7_1231 [Wickerhamomyces ciferrii]CCH41690.1 hypothetical protein BN7_1231 [Wickerhamomyces ciferrii]